MKLAVLIGGQFAGEADVGGAPTSFRYDLDYRRASAIPLSLVVPLAGGGTEGDKLHNWLLGTLPDDPAVLDSLCAEHNADRHNPLGLLAGPMGTDCAGAVQFCPPDKAEALIADPGGADPISDGEIADWLDRMETDPARRAYLTDSADTGFSIGGMQPKAALRRTASGGWAVPHGSLPTTHLVKASRPDRWPHEIVVEHLTMRTAAGCGIPTARTETRCIAGKEVIVVERYDRTTAGTVRVHQEDMCQALGVPPHRKYQRNGGPGPRQIADALRAADPDRAAENIERLCDILLFLWVAASTDGHAKNLSVLHAGDGGVRLAPLYDACSWLPYRKGIFEKKTQMAMKIGTDYSLKTADTADAFRRTADRLGMSLGDIARRATRIADNAGRALEAALTALPGPAADNAEVDALRRELPDRAARCAEIAETANVAASGAASATAFVPALPGKPEWPRCSHVGPRTRKQCIRPAHNGDDHRY